MLFGSVTEDYSSYESVGDNEEDEEEEKPVTKAKLKATATKEAVGSRAASPSVDQPVKTVVKSAPSMKRKPSGTAKLAKGAGSISNFFNPKAKK